MEQANGAVSLFKIRPLAAAAARRAVLVLGNEISGLPPGILKHAVQIIEVPMAGKKESLNVAVAFGIAAYHLCPPRAKSSSL